MVIGNGMENGMEALGKSINIRHIAVGALLCIAALGYYFSVNSANFVTPSKTEITPKATNLALGTQVDPHNSQTAEISSEINFSVRAISASDKTAVIELPGSNLEVIRFGDKLSGLDLYVIQITHEKVVLRRSATSESYFVFLSKYPEKSKWQKTSNQLAEPDYSQIQFIKD